MYTVYFIFFQVASATATRIGLSRGLLGLQYDQINESESESESCSPSFTPTLPCTLPHILLPYSLLACPPLLPYLRPADHLNVHRVCVFATLHWMVQRLAMHDTKTMCIHGNNPGFVSAVRWQPACLSGALKQLPADLFQRSLLPSANAPTNPFLTNSKKIRDRHVHRTRHKHGRRSYLSDGIGGDSQSLLEREPLRGKYWSLLSYNIDTRRVPVQRAAERDEIPYPWKSTTRRCVIIKYNGLRVPQPSSWGHCAQHAVPYRNIMDWSAVLFSTAAVA